MSSKGQKAFFLDRDGVINFDHGYVHKIEDFEFVTGVFDACRQIIKNGFKIIIVTNQAGIGRGFYSTEQFTILTSWMIEQFNQENIDITDVRYCPHHAKAGIGEYLKDCQFRKPNPGMILAAADKFAISLRDSVLVGDKLSDIQAGKKAGIPSRYLITPTLNQIPKTDEFLVCHNLKEAVHMYFNDIKTLI